MESSSKKLLDQVRDAICLKPYSYRIEETYLQWIRHYILFHNKFQKAPDFSPARGEKLKILTLLQQNVCWDANVKVQRSLQYQRLALEHDIFHQTLTANKREQISIS